jgi:hypothetical protein
MRGSLSLRYSMSRTLGLKVRDVGKVGLLSSGLSYRMGKILRQAFKPVGSTSITYAYLGY